MIVTLDIPEELTRSLGTAAERMSREALAIEAHQQGLQTELGSFLGLSRIALDRLLKDHGVELAHIWEDLERERETHCQLADS